MNDTTARPSCPVGHSLPEGAAFCPECGVPTRPDEPATRASRRAYATAGAGTVPFKVLGTAHLDETDLVKWLLIAPVLVEMVTWTVGGPRLFYYALLTGAVFLVVVRSKEFTGRTLALVMATSAVSFLLITQLVRPLMNHALGYSGWLAVPTSAWQVVAPIGAFALALLLAAAAVPHARQGLLGFTRPAPPAWDPARVVIVAVLAALALVTVGRSLTGWAGFSLPQRYGVAECTAGVDAQFPEYSGIERQAAIDYCVKGL